ncbi:MAG TPA: DNA polymerase III subunit gamma/tau [Patescibacteria group bacterium]|nr:DNA polymerase III subunit gamma/tau [Patescibacteria group bacterium]
MTLYLKYRPQTLDELDLESVRTNLKNILSSGNIPHAFLFSGPKGTGKTSAARILAKIINCTNLTKDGEPCNSCTSCLSITNGNSMDIIELDAASNRGIDDIRALKEGVYLAPVSSKKKIYIIDEAHMLTLEAANAFLKTLEEPPAHVIFILATTNPEKLPQTVISRLTQINFTKASVKDISRQLNRVAKGENIKIEDKAIEKISKFADGSFRDAVKILETLSFKTKDIKEADVDNLFQTSANSSLEFFQILETRNTKNILEFIENFIKNGGQIKNLTTEILENIHQSILGKNNLGEDNLANFSLEELINLNNLISESLIQNSPINHLPFEIAIIKFCGEQKSEPAEEKKIKKPLIEIKTEPKIENPERTLSEVERGVEGKKVALKSLDETTWAKLIENSRNKNFGIEALLRAAKPLGYDGNVLNLGVYYQFHKDKLEENKNKIVLEKVCVETFGIDSIKINLELLEKPKIARKIEETNLSKPDLTPKVDKDIIDAAKEIFG